MNDQPERVRTGWMFRMTGAAALAMLFLTSGLAGVSCSDDDFIDQRPRNQAGGFVDGGAGGDAEESLCPPSPPRVGENCTTSMENAISCTFVVDTCVHPTGTFDITIDYCCARGTVWEACATNTTPCDRDDAAAPPPPAPPDSGAPADASAG
jgi:hypothetical protein